MYMVFGNDERMNEARKLLSVEKTQDVVCVFQPNVKVSAYRGARGRTHSILTRTHGGFLPKSP